MVVAAARAADRPVPTAARGSRARRGGERGAGAPPRSWLGRAALSSAELSAALGHFTAVLRRRGRSGTVPGAGRCPGRPASILLNLGQLAEGTQEGRRSLAMARELGYPAGEGIALRILGIAAWYSGDYDGAIQLIRQQQLMTGMPDSIARRGNNVIDLRADRCQRPGRRRKRLRGGGGPVPGHRRREQPAVPADGDGGPGRSGRPKPRRRRCTSGKGSRPPPGPAPGGTCSTACGSARCCALRPGARPTA